MGRKKTTKKKESRKCGATTRHDWKYYGGVIKCSKCGKVAEDQKMYIGKW